MTVLLPEIRDELIPSYQKELNEKQKVLFVGQMISSGTATAGTLIEKIGNANQQDNLFGKASMLATMVRSAKKINNGSRFDAIALADVGAGVAATGTIAFSGTASAAGTIVVTIGSLVNNTYSLSISASDTATAIGDKLIAAIVADSTSLVTGVNTDGSVALTYAHKGEEGNDVGLYVSGTVAGVTYAVTAMASGATNPVLTSIFDLCGNNRYQTIVLPATYSTAEVISFLGERFNAPKRILDGVAIVCHSDTVENLISEAEALNSQSLVIFGNKAINETYYKAQSMLEMGCVVASQFAALRSLRLTDNSDLSEYVISTNGARDAFGGTKAASLPYFNTPFYNLPLIPSSYELTDQEMEDLTEAGVAILGNNPGRTGIICGQVVTTYKTDPASNPDKTFEFLNYVDTETNIREYMVDNLRARLSQSRLTDGDVVPNVNMVNGGMIGAFIDGLYNDLSGEEYVLTQGGTDAMKYFKENRNVVIDIAQGLATVTMIVPIVTQLRKIYISTQISF